MLRTSFAASDPLPIIWNPIERLCKFAQKAQNPYSDVQKIDFGLQLIRNTRDFEQALDRWEEKTDANKTWTNLKTHFAKEQKKLKKIRGPTMMQVGFANANHIANTIREEMQSSNTELLNLLSSMNNENPPPATDATTYTTPSDLTEEQANLMAEGHDKNIRI